MIQLKSGDNIAWGSTFVAEVIDIFPKGRVLCWGYPDSGRLREFVLDTRIIYVTKIEVGDGYELVDKSKPILCNDQAYVGNRSGWVSLPLKYDGDLSPFRVRRRIHA